MESRDGVSPSPVGVGSGTALSPVKFYAEIMHVCAKIILGLHPVNRGKHRVGVAVPFHASPLNMPLSIGVVQSHMRGICVHS